jgi:hypothetical protein
VNASLATMKALGADRVRVSVYWHLIDPAQPETWERYDTVVRLAAANRLSVLFTLTVVPDRGQPSAEQFRAFAEAAGERYSGTFVPMRKPPPPPSPEPEPGPLPPIPPMHAAQDGALPRVSAWSFLNEPNQPGWLSPQWVAQPKLTPASPRIYRYLVDAGWAGPEATGHGRDLILLGETAPRGQRPGINRPIAPLSFIRELYCLNRRLRALRGGAATARGCPADGRGFAAAHPALFGASGWAHHPYALKSPPSRSDRGRDNVVLADLSRLTRTLDRALRRYGVRRRLRVWITEYGYQTTPPDPTVGISPRRQAAWLAEADYLAFRNRRVASTAQFLLVDDGPRTEFAPDEPRYWGSFQSGLIALDGSRKPAFHSWPKPFHVARSGRRRITVFGQLRPAADGRAPRAVLQFSADRRSWSKVATLRPNRRGFVLARVRLRRGGNWRLAWGAAGATRAVAVRLR